jgi:hypothetical protein
MIILFPSIILLTTAAILSGIHVFRPRFNASWLVAAIGAFLSWLSLLFLRFRLPTSLVYLQWSKSTINIDSPMLAIDYSSWPFAFAIGTLILAIVISSPVNLQSRAEIITLSGNLAITGISLFAFLASNLIALLIGWAVIDLMELTVLLRKNHRSDINQRVIIGFTSRIGGLMLIFWAIVLGGQLSGNQTDFMNLSPFVSLPILLGISLRLGLFPIHLVYTEEIGIRRSQGNLFRFIPPAASLVFLSRIPPETMNNDFVFVIKIFIFIAASYGVIRWLTEKAELATRPFWVMILSSFAILSTLNGNPYASISWGVTMILVGGTLYLHDSRTRLIQILLIIGLIFSAGFPYTPNAVGVMGLIGSDNIFNEIISLILLLLLLVGLYKIIFMKPMLALGQEKIIYLTYPLSIIFIITSYLLIGLFGWPGSRTIGAWPAILTAIVIIILSMLVNKRYSHIFQEHKATIFRILNNFPHLQKNISSFVSFSWIYKGLDLIIGMVGKIVNQFTFMLEGNNGLLWGMVLLIILVMIIGLRV